MDAQVQKYLLSEDPGELAGASEMYYHVQQYYDSLMMFAHAADALLKQDPSLPAEEVRGKRLYDSILKTRFVASQGKIVIDGFGLKDGFFCVRNIWGKQKIKVLLLDSWAKKAVDFFNPNTTVTDLSGKISWQFQGQPVLFMGNTSVSPTNVVLGNCPAGKFLVKTAEGELDCKPCAPGFFIERDDSRGYMPPPLPFSPRLPPSRSAGERTFWSDRLQRHPEP
jgi:hypothetical protein